MTASKQADAHRIVVMIHGPIAVGKLTVGRALAERTSLSLLDAHATIDLVTRFFPFGTPEFSRVNRSVIDAILQEVLRAGRGLVLTHIWNFDDPESAAGIKQLDQAINGYGGKLVFAELQASLEERLRRNELPARRASKDVSWATPDYVRSLDERHQTASGDHFPYPDRHLVLDTEVHSAEEAAAAIHAHFGLG